jgi:hypothetical protein
MKKLYFAICIKQFRDEGAAVAAAAAVGEDPLNSQ